MFNRRKPKGTALRMSWGAAHKIGILKANPKAAAAADFQKKKAEFLEKHAKTIETIKELTGFFCENVAIANALLVQDKTQVDDKITADQVNNKKWQLLEVRYSLIALLISLGEEFSKLIFDWIKVIKTTTWNAEQDAWYKFRSIVKHLGLTIRDEEFFEFVNKVGPLIFQVIGKLESETGSEYITKQQKEYLVKLLGSSVAQYTSLSDCIAKDGFCVLYKKEVQNIKNELEHMEFFILILRNKIPLINAFSRPFLQETNSNADIIVYDNSRRIAICELLNECVVYYTQERQKVFEDFTNSDNPLCDETPEFRADFISFLTQAKDISNKMGHVALKVTHAGEVPSAAVTDQALKDICLLARKINAHAFKVVEESSLLRQRAMKSGDSKQPLAAAHTATAAAPKSPANDPKKIKPTIKYSLAELKAAALPYMQKTFPGSDDVAEKLIGEISLIVGSDAELIPIKKLRKKLRPADENKWLSVNFEAECTREYKIDQSGRYVVVELVTRVINCIVKYNPQDDQDNKDSIKNIQNFVKKLLALKECFEKIKNIRLAGKINEEAQSIFTEVEGLIKDLKLLKSEILKIGFKFEYLVDDISLSNIKNPCLIVHRKADSLLLNFDDAIKLGSWSHPSVSEIKIDRKFLVVIEDPDYLAKIILGLFVLYSENIEKNWVNHKQRLLREPQRLASDEKEKADDSKVVVSEITNMGLPLENPVDDNNKKPREMFSEVKVLNLLQGFNRKSAEDSKRYIDTFKEEFGKHKNSDLKTWCKTKLDSSKILQPRNFRRIIQNLLEQASLCCENQPLDLTAIDEQIEIIDNKLATLIQEHVAKAQTTVAKPVDSKHEEPLQTNVVNDNTKNAKIDVEKPAAEKPPTEKKPPAPLFTQDEIRQKLGLTSLTSQMCEDLKNNIISLLNFIKNNPKPSSTALKRLKNDNLKQDKNKFPVNYIEIINNLLENLLIYFGKEEIKQIKDNLEFIKALLAEKYRLLIQQKEKAKAVEIVAPVENLNIEIKNLKQESLKFVSDIDMALQKTKSQNSSIDSLNEKIQSVLYIYIKSGNYDKAIILIDRGANMLVICWADKDKKPQTSLELLEEHAANGIIKAKALLEYYRRKIQQEAPSKGALAQNQKNAIIEKSKKIHSCLNNKKYDEAFSILLSFAKNNFPAGNEFDYFGKMNEAAAGISKFIGINTKDKAVKQFSIDVERLAYFRQILTNGINRFYCDLEAKLYGNIVPELEALALKCKNDKELFNTILDEKFDPNKPTIRNFLVKVRDGGENNKDFIRILDVFKQDGVSLDLDAKNNNSAAISQSNPAQTNQVANYTDVWDAQKQTPLYLTIKVGNYPSAKWLINQGADMLFGCCSDIKAEQKTPLSLLQEQAANGIKEAITLLQYYRKKIQGTAAEKVATDTKGDQKLVGAADPNATAAAHVLPPASNDKEQSTKVANPMGVAIQSLKDAVKNKNLEDILQKLVEYAKSEFGKNNGFTSLMKSEVGKEATKLILTSDDLDWGFSLLTRVRLRNEDGITDFYLQLKDERYFVLVGVLQHLINLNWVNNNDNKLFNVILDDDFGSDKLTIRNLLIQRRDDGEKHEGFIRILKIFEQQGVSLDLIPRDKAAGANAPVPASSATKEVAKADAKKPPASTMQSFFPPAGSATATAAKGDQKRVEATDSKATVAALAQLLAIPDAELKPNDVSEFMVNLTKLALNYIMKKEYNQAILLFSQCAKMNLDKDNAFNIILKSDTFNKIKTLIQDNQHEPGVQRFINKFNILCHFRERLQVGVTAFYLQLKNGKYAMASHFLHTLIDSDNKIADTFLLDTILDEDFGPNEPTIRELLVELRKGGEKNKDFIHILDLLKDQGVDLDLNTKTACSPPAPKP